MEVVNLAGDYSSGTNWAASATSGGTPSRQATAPGDFNDSGVVDGSDFLFWQRGVGGTFSAADLTIWRASFGNGAPTAITSTAGQPGNAASLNYAGSGLIFAAAFTRGPWWLVVEDGELASSKSRGEIKAAATDAALAEWAPRHRSSFVADDFSAAVASNDHEAGDDFAALYRFGSAHRSLSLGDHMCLNLGGEVVFSWRSCSLASSCDFGPC
jgi:hypothetical protein